jgi:DNA-binding GntR family transcriptional regulator
MDQQFHEAIARASRNVTLARILIPLQHKAARFWVWSMGADGEAALLAEIASHRAVFDAIAEGDPERARTAVLRTLGAFSDDAQRAVNGSADRRSSRGSPLSAQSP